jgi:putative oxidoreductase
MLLNSEPVSLDFGLLALRLGAGGTMLWQHGWGKLIGFADKMDSFPDPFGAGPMVSLGLITLAETACAGLVLLGLWTRITTIPLIIGMAVAAFMVAGGKSFAQQELAVLYLLAFLTLFFTGSGRFSLDRLTFH